MLGRRGEDQRFDESRPAAHRRRAIDDAYGGRAEGESRADVARRVGDVDESGTDQDAPDGQQRPDDWGWHEDDPDRDGPAADVSHPLDPADDPDPQETGRR